MARIVGIGGKLASGKDAISDHLVEKHGWVKLGMSDALADALYTLNPYIVEKWTEYAPVPNRFFSWRKSKSLVVDIDYQRIRRYQEIVDEVGYVKAKEISEVRRLLQVLGTEVGRKMISESVWTDIAARKVREAVARGVPGVVLTGVRFPNELEMLEEELGGETWWVTRPSLESGQNASHASENSVSSVDFERTIWNDGTLEELYQKVDQIVS